LGHTLHGAHAVQPNSAERPLLSDIFVRAAVSSGGRNTLAHEEATREARGLPQTQYS